MTLNIQFDHRWQVRLVDTDMNGFAHFSSYVRMMEETEYAFLRSRGLSVVLKDNRGTIGFPRIAVDLNIERQLKVEDWAKTRLRLIEIDGKQIVYEFLISNEFDLRVATGHFVVACCRFPADKPHYAILIPDFVAVALTATD
jgi:acyl-CoA thioesterase FadM